MTKFVCVNEEPSTLDNGEMVIHLPKFMDEIQACHRHRPSNNLTGPFYLREVAQRIGAKYVGESFNVFGDLNFSNALGIPIDSEEVISDIMLKVFEASKYNIVELYLDKVIKERPRNTKLVWFVGGSKFTNPFYANGLDPIDYKHIDEYMGRSKKNKTKKDSSENE